MVTCPKVLRSRVVPVLTRKRSRRPQRLQRRIDPGGTMQDLSPDGAYVICVNRPSQYANPFRVGGWFMLGDPNPVRGWPRMQWCEANPASVDNRFTLMTTPAQAVAWYEALLKRHPLTPGVIAQLRGYHLACYCPVGEPCHADVLLRIVNQPQKKPRRAVRRVPPRRS